MSQEHKQEKDVRKGKSYSEIYDKLDGPEDIRANPDSMSAENLDKLTNMYKLSPIETAIQKAHELGFSKTLTDQEQAVWIMIVIQGYSKLETSKQIGISAWTVDKRLLSANTKFKKFIKDHNLYE